MKSKRNLSHLVKQFLKSSPRYLAQKRASILPPEYRQNTAKLPTDEQYIKNFIVHVDCTYMYNYFGPPTINQQKMFLHKKTFVNPLSAGLIRRKAVEINDKAVDKKSVLFELIKGVNKDKNTVMRYTELQEFLMKLSIEQTRQYKKFIVYLYKWLLNEKHSFPVNSIQCQLCQETSETIIKKIYESHQSGDYEILKNTEEELLTIETLEKARQMKRNGKILQAKEIYQTVYFARLTEQIDRLQALEYICEKCKQQHDTQFLEKMIDKIKEGLGLKSHQKILLRTINEINDLKTPLDHTLNNLSTTQQTLEEQKAQQKVKTILLDEVDSKEPAIKEKGKNTILREILGSTKNH